MSTNRNWEQEHHYTLMEVREYIKDEGPEMFLQDLELTFPEVYEALLEVFRHRINSLNHKEIPALLRNYRK